MPYAEGSFLASLDAADVEALRGAGRERSYQRGDYLIHEGDRPATVLFILAGIIKLTKSAANGREVVLEIRVSGDVVGELGAIDGRPRSANVVAISDVRALTVTSERFRILLGDRVGMANTILITVVHRLRRATDRQLELGTTDGLGRVCARLVELSVSHGVEGAGGTTIDLGISQHELADWCGMSRDGVIRALRDLRQTGLVDTGRRSVVLRDLEGLRRRGSIAE